MFSIFKNILKSNNANIIFSIIWGLGLASLFRRVCKGRECIVYRAPSLNSIKGKTFGFNNKCYNYIPRLVKCQGKNIIAPEEFNSTIPTRMSQ